MLTTLLLFIGPSEVIQFIIILTMVAHSICNTHSAKKIPTYIHAIILGVSKCSIVDWKIFDVKNFSPVA